MSMKKVMIVIGLLSLGIGGYIYIYKFTGSEPESVKLNLNSKIRKYVAAEGKVEAMPGHEVEIGSEIEGRIAEFSVKEGDFIEKGGLIARLENSDIQAKLKEAEGELSVAKAKLKEVASGYREEEIKRAAASLERTIAEREEAETVLERYKNLYKDGVVSKGLLDEKERVFKVTEARVKESEEEKRLLEKGPKAETLKLHEDTVKRTEATVEYYKELLRKTYITAPISGKVIHKYLEEGEVIIREIYLAAIADVEKIRINAEVDETDIGRIKVGDHAEVTSDAYPGKVFEGEIQEIYDYVGIRRITPNNPVKNLDMKVVQVKIGLKEKTPFKIGMTTDVKIIPTEIAKE